MGVFDDVFEGMKETLGSSLEGETKTYEGVEVLQDRDKSRLIRFPNNPEAHWVAKSQSELTGNDLTVTQWLVEKWAEEGFNPDKPAPGFTIPGCICMRETEAAIQVQVPNHGLVWFPKRFVLPDSAVKEDSDQGDLVVTQWIAEEKSLVGGSPGGKTTRTAQDDLGQEDSE